MGAGPAGVDDRLWFSKGEWVRIRGSNYLYRVEGRLRLAHSSERRYILAFESNGTIHQLGGDFAERDLYRDTPTEDELLTWLLARLA